MKLKHNIAVAKFKGQDPDCLGQHIHHLILEGQDVINTFMSGNRFEIVNLLKSHIHDYENDFFTAMDMSESELSFIHLLVACLQTNEGEIPRDVLKNYFENYYLKYFLSMNAKSFFTYSALITSVVEDLQERELTNYNFNQL